MPPEEITEADLALLNPAERAIMEAGDEEDEPLHEDDDEHGGVEQKTASVTELSSDGAADSDADALTFTAKTPKDAPEQRAALQARKNDSFAKMLAGEIDPEAYQKVEAEVSASMESLLQASITDAVTSELTQAQVAKQWNSEVSAMVKAAKIEGIDYKADEKLNTEFFRLIHMHGLEASAAGMNDQGLKASKWALEQAHRTMKARYPELLKPQAVDSDKSKATARLRADMSAIPPSLKGAPIAASASINDEFAHMDGLTGASQERAFARLSHEQQNRWLDA